MRYFAATLTAGLATLGSAQDAEIHDAQHRWVFRLFSSSPRSLRFPAGNEAGGVTAL